MNSASLRFVPVAKLESEGYGEYANSSGKLLTPQRPLSQLKKLNRRSKLGLIKESDASF